MAHKVGDTVTVTRGPHKGDAHKVIHVHKDGRVNVKPHNKMPHQIKYRHGAATASANDVKKMKEDTMLQFEAWMVDTGWKKPSKVRKDKFGNVVKDKNVAKNLARKAMKKTKDGEKKQVDEIARSMTPMRDKFGKSKAEKEAEAKKKEAEKSVPAKKDEGYVSHAQRKAVWANKADGGKGHPDKKEGTIITPKDFKMKDDDKNKLKKIADLMKKAKATTESVAGPKDCWDGYKKDGTKPGTGKNKGKRVNNCVPKNENQNAALQKKLAKSAQSSEKGKKAVTLKKAPFRIPSKNDMKNEGGMKRMSTGDGMDTFKKKPPVKKEVLDKDKDHMSYRQKAKYSADRARNSATAKIVRGDDGVDKEKNTMRKRAAGMAMSDRKGVRQFRKFHGYDKKK